MKIFKSARLNTVPSLESEIPFGYYVSDHMLELDYENTKWDRPVISPYHKLQIDPCNSTLHYAIQLYEGIYLIIF